MNKKVFGRKLSRSRPSREALFASLASELIKNGKIVTTRAKAKAVTPLVEKLVTNAKKGSVQSRRKALAILDNSKQSVNILFGDVAKAFSAKSSGFTRIISLPRRVGDNAMLARLEWTEKVDYGVKDKVISSKETKKTGKSEKAKAVKKTVKKTTK